MHNMMTVSSHDSLFADNVDVLELDISLWFGRFFFLMAIYYRQNKET